MNSKSCKLLEKEIKKMMFHCLKGEELQMKYTRWTKQISLTKDKNKMKKKRKRKYIIPQNLKAIMETKTKLKVTQKTNSGINSNEKN